MTIFKNTNLIALSNEILARRYNLIFLDFIFVPKLDKFFHDIKIYILSHSSKSLFSQSEDDSKDYHILLAITLQKI
jgi:hypothetical protein